MGPAAGRDPAGRRERLRLRRHELPRRARGARARAPPWRRRDAGVVRRRRRSATSTAAPSSVAAPARGRRHDAAAAGRSSPAPPTTPALARRLREVADARPRGERARAGPPDAGRPRAHRCGWPSTTATPPSWPTRRAGRPRRSRPATPAMWRALRAPGRVPRPGRARQGRVPLHRPGLAVRQHAEDACASRSRSSRTRSPRPTG